VGTDTAGGTEKFEAAGSGQEEPGAGELASVGKDFETDGEGDPLENTGPLDDGGAANATGGGLDGAGSEPEVDAEPSRTLLPHPTSAITAAVAQISALGSRAFRVASAAGKPTVASRRPAQLW
jgi:hypothetical protein